jgi:hypothetical protein
MAGETFRRLSTCIRFSAKDKNGNSSSSTFFNMLGTRAMTGFAPFPVTGIPGHCLFAMNRFGEAFVISLMAILAGFRAGIL